jgi:GNAT superfamily N-acetyltransferase
MATIAAGGDSAAAGVRRKTALLETARVHKHGWVVRRARPSDARAVKALFWKLHAFNADLEPRFALAQDWEAHVDPLLDQAFKGNERLCLLARQRDTGEPGGFPLAAIHRDSGLWRHHEWVEVEALYVEAAWRGCGLAAELLARACAWAAEMGQPVIQFYVTATNERALRFYRREGFQHTQAILRKVVT